MMEKPLDAPFFNGFFELHGSAATFTESRPDKFPGPFKSFRGLGQLIMRVVVLPQPTFRVAAVPAIISSRGFALDDIDEKEHTKKAGDNPGLSICGSPSRTRTYNLVVNPAAGGTLPVEHDGETSRCPFF
jgi:hypothetical protein